MIATKRLLALIFLFSLSSTIVGQRPNVLFIAIDDLRTDLGCYGHPEVKSPNIDRLAATGVRFDRAYCQQAICGPSRASLLTGLRPDSTGVHGNHTHFRTRHPDLITLPQAFKESGWDTRSFGKIWHGPFPKGSSRTVADTFDDPVSWSAAPFKPGPRYYWTDDGIAAAKRVFEQVYQPKDPKPDDWTKKLVFGPATEAPDVEDGRLYDGQVARAAVASMREMAAGERPFFLAVGFIKPHSPYIAPRRYFDLYEGESLSIATQMAMPDGAPRIAGHGSGELRRYTDQPGRGPIPEAHQRRVRHAYRACTSYVDAQVGLLLDELDRLKIADDTIVVLWSDHGYHLGEKGLWGKTTNFERDARVPLIIRKPGAKGNGRPSNALVELVDVYPTLVSLAGIPVDARLEGLSVGPLLEAPDRPWKRGAFTQYTRGRRRGYSVRTEHYRYTEWLELDTGRLIASELYDHDHDPIESRNLASTPEHADTVRRMSHVLARGHGWRKCRPTTRGPELRLHPVFGDGVVLQRDKPIPFFGTARPRSRISASLGGEVEETVADRDGRWRVTFRPREASTRPLILQVAARFGGLIENTLCRDAVIGDVWICSGQSNMRWRVDQSESASAVAATPPDRLLRLLDFEGRVYPIRKVYPRSLLTDVSATSYYRTAGWRGASPETAKTFSAVAYHFGARLRRELDVPIGLIHDAIGGVPMESYIPHATLVADEALRPCLDGWLQNEHVPEWCRQRGRYNLTKWFDDRVGVLPRHPFEPGFLAAASTEQLAGFGVRGFIWYQGESNATTGGGGTPARPMPPEKHKFAALIRSWRRLWNDPTLPFYFVQLPGLNRDWKPFREMQLEIEREVPHTGMAVITDLGHETDVHPRRKKPVGARLARLALAGTYGKAITPTGPRPTHFLFEDGRAVVTLTHATGLAPRGGAPLVGFEVAGEDRVFHAAEGTIEGTRVTVRSAAVPAPVAVRYAWRNDPSACNLVNGDDLPATPFRSDDWPIGAAAPIAIPDGVLSFETIAVGPLRNAKSKGWTVEAAEGHAAVNARFAHSGGRSLHILGGARRSVELTLPARTREPKTLAMRAERWTRRDPFSFRIDAAGRSGPWKEVCNGDFVRVGARFLSDVRCAIPSGTARVRLRCTAAEGGGLLIDDVAILAADAMPQPPVVRGGVIVRAPGQDGVHTYRIPGLATTNAGTLIAVYDNRYRGSGDLPGDIDVGMSRSTDGGETWDPMRVIMDMGNDPRWRHDGIGDPAVLVDRKSGTIWVAATWSHGDRAWRGSGPGMTPEETGQLMLVKSDDDGLTWSKPINITNQVKKPEWRYVLQGPGKGITMRDGTLVFAAQYRSSDRSPHEGKPFSTIIWSKDGGETWSIGTGVKVDTTEAQVVELKDGSLMINCRDNRGGSRSIYTTRDLGRTWRKHITSRKALPEPVCMASLIRIEHDRHGPLLIFSNPATTRGRHHMTIKISRDEGRTWPARYHTLYDERPGAGYSCLTRIDADRIGVLYEGRRFLRFIAFEIDELLRGT